MEWPLGIIAVMAVMAATMGGGTGVRLLFIDKKYRHIISEIEKKKNRISGKTKEISVKEIIQYARYEQDISRLTSKMYANRNGVFVDGVLMCAILSLGALTALGINPPLYLVALVAFIFFIASLAHYYNHLQTVLNRY